MYNGSITIKFNEKGEIVSLANARGTEFCSARRLPLVTIQTIKDRNRYLWNSSEADCKAENCDGGISFTFTGGGFTVKAEVAFKEDGAVTQLGGLFQRKIEQLFPIALSFEFRRDADGAHGQDRYHPAVVGFDHGLHEHILSDQAAVLL